MTFRSTSRTLWALVALALLAAAAAPRARTQEGPPREEKAPANAEARDEGKDESPAVAYGTLEEVRNKRLVRLLVIRPRTVDASDPTQGVPSAVVSAVTSGAETNPRLRWTHDLIARRLNKYIRKYRSMTAIPPGMEPDYIIVFHLLRYRVVLNGVYPSGEMYVVAYKPPGPPRVLWRTQKEMFEEDATKELLKALKAARGEK